MNENHKLPPSLLVALWEEFGNIPIDGSEEERTELGFCGWPTGTPRMEIWHWFDAQFPQGLGVYLDPIQRQQSGV